MSNIETYEIIWQNYAPYSPGNVKEIMKFVENNMEGLLSLYPREKKRLQNYSDTNDIPIEILKSMRNQLRSQKEVFFKLGEEQRNYIMTKYDQFLEKLERIDKSNEELVMSLIINFYGSVKAPPRIVYEIIKNTNNFTDMDINVQELLEKPINDLIEEDRAVTIAAREFEETFEAWFSKSGIKFKTEKDIRIENAHNLTPDFLLDVPIIIKKDDIDYEIHWIDVKNYFMTDVKIMQSKLRKQSQKYNEAFGNGAFVFHYGFDPSIQISDTLILNGSFLD